MAKLLKLDNKYTNLSNQEFDIFMVIEGDHFVEYGDFITDFANSKTKKETIEDFLDIPDNETNKQRVDNFTYKIKDIISNNYTSEYEEHANNFFLSLYRELQLEKLIDE